MNARNPTSPPSVLARLHLQIRLAWRFLAASSGLALLNILGVAVGVAVVLAVQISNRSALAAFRSTLDVVAGKSNLEISGDGSRFDERVFRDIRLHDRVIHASPVIEAILMTPDHPGDYLRLTGLDPFSHQPFLNFEFSSDSASDGIAGLSGKRAGRTLDWLTDPDGVAVTATLGKKLGLHPGDRLAVMVDGRRRELRVRDWIHFDRDHTGADDHLAVMDIASAQELLGAVGKLDRIHLIVRGEPKEIIPAFQKMAPPNAVVALPSRRGTQIANMLGAFQLNLAAMSLIALLVAAFLLHATMTTFVARQRRALGILRAVGFTPREVRAVVMFEALWVAATGIAAGLPIGLLLAQWSRASMNTAVSSLYLLVHTERIAVNIPTLLAIAGIGFASALAAAWRPAREASEVSPVEALSPAAPSRWLHEHHGLFAKLSWACLALAVVTAWLALRTDWRWLGFVAGFAWVVALAGRTPAWTHALARLLGRIMPRGKMPLAMDLGIRNLTGSLHRTTVAVAAFMTAFAMMLGTSVMIDSFRRTVEYWLSQSVRADVYLTTAANLQYNAMEALPPEAIRGIPKIRGVSDVDTYHEIWVDAPETEGRSPRKVKLACIDFGVVDRHRHLSFKGAAPSEFSSMGASRTVLVNESLSSHFRKRVGDSIAVRTPSGPVEFRVGGVFYDYSTDSGMVLVDHKLYAELWRDPKIYSYALYLDGSRPALEVKEEIVKRYGQESRLAVFLNRELREQVLRVFDQTFAITLGLRAVAVAVAALAVFLTLATLIAERGREMAVARAIGMSRAGVMGMALSEAALLGALGWFMGCVGGLGLSGLLAFVINKAYFGWSIQWRLDPSLFLTALILALPASLLAGLLSGFRAVKTPIVESLRYE